jgi:hypothetical protein
VSAELIAQLRSAADAITEASIQRGRPASPPAQVAITERDLQLLEWLEQLNYLTTTMIGVLLWGDVTYAVRRRLKLLHDGGYLARVRPVTAGGSAEWIYQLTEKSWRVLAAADRARLPRFITGRLHSISYVEHDIQLSAMLLQAALAAYPGDGPLAARLPFTWIGAHSGRIDPRAEERSTAISNAARMVREAEHSREAERGGVLEPDATLLGCHAASDRPLTVLVEYDRTRRPSKQVSRLERYDRFLTYGWTQTRFAHQPFPPLVLYVVEADSAIDPLIRVRQAGSDGGSDLRARVLSERICCDVSSEEVPA